MTTATRQIQLVRRRALTPALALAVVYLVGGLLGNLHLVLVDHHSDFAHAHHHGQAACPDAEWVPSDSCGDHHVLADHDVVVANTQRMHKDAAPSAVLSPAVSRCQDGAGDRSDFDQAPPSPYGDLFCSAPTRAPPADLLSA